MGDFDEYLAQKFEGEWSCELPEEFKPKRGGTASSSSATATPTDVQGKPEDVIEGNYDADEKEMSKEDIETTLDGEATEELDVKLGSPAPHTPHIVLGSPVLETQDEKGQEVEDNVELEKQAHPLNGQEAGETPEQQQG